MTTNAPRLNVSAIPEELRALHQWVAYTLAWNETRGKYDKAPYNVRTGRLASSTDPKSWTSFAEALAGYHDGQYGGVGFVFTPDDPYAGIDLDGCYDAEAERLAEWAANIVEGFESYTELSPSGTGLHILVRGALPGGGHNKKPIEVYDQGRFFTITGQVVDGRDVIHERSHELEDFYRQHFGEERGYHVATDAELIERAKAAANGDKFTRLWQGDDSDYGGDASAGDLALATMLVFWAEGDTLRADRLFRLSNRVRAKWDERHYGNGETYGQHTISIAFETWRKEQGATVGPIEAAPSRTRELPSFPLDQLPRIVQQFGAEGALTLDAAPELIVIPMLAFASAAIGTTRRIRLNADWEESSLLWMGVVGDPGMKKTPAIQLAGRPYHEWHKEEMLRFRVEWERYKEALERRRPAGEAKPLAPLRRQRLVDDTTMEALSLVFQDDEHGVILDRDELTGFVGSMNQYKAKGSGADRSNWLSVWSGRHITINRKGDPNPIYVERPFVSLIGGIQPEKLGALAGEERENDGFLDRFLFCVIPKLPAQARHDSYMTDDTVLNWRATIRALLMIETPQIVPLSREADIAWQEASERHAEERNAPDLDPLFRGFYAKAEGYAGRLALVLHELRFTTYETEEPILDAESVRGAWALMDYFKGTTEYVYSQIEETIEDRKIARLLTYVKAHGGVVTNRDIQQGRVAGVRGAKEAIEALRLLEDHGHGWTKSENVTGGQRVTFTLGERKE